MSGGNVRAKELKPEKIQEACRAASGHLAVVEANAVIVVRHGNDWCDDGLSGRSYEGVNRGGDTDSQPLRHALAPRTDPIAALIVEFHKLTHSLVRDALRYRRVAEALSQVRDMTLAYQPEEGESRSAGTGKCLVCDHECVGTSNDRKQAGMCPKHYQRWVRAGRPIDKHEIADRPEEDVA